MEFFPEIPQCQQSGHSAFAGTQVQYLVRELRSHRLQGAAEKKKKKSFLRNFS